MDHLNRFARELARAAIDLEGLVFKVKIFQRVRRCAEGIGLDDVRSGAQKPLVDEANPVRLRERQCVDAICDLAEFVRQHGAAHAAIAYQDALAERRQKITHCKIGNCK